MPGFNIPFSVTCHEENAFQQTAAFDGPTYKRETGRSHRYVLEVFEPFGNKSTGILLFLNKCTRPSAEIDEITIHNGQDEIYRPGKHRWKTIELTFYEVFEDEGEEGTSTLRDQTAQLMFRLWANQTVNINSSNLAPQDSIKDAQLDMLDGVGNAMWTYYIYRAWPTKVSPSTLSYADTNISEITATLRYDKAIEADGQARLRG